MILRKKSVPSYLFSFVVGFVFGKLPDVHEAWINVFPYNIPMRVVYFAVSYCLLSLGIGTIAAAFTMGKAIGFAGDVLDKRFVFKTYKRG